MGQAIPTQHPAVVLRSHYRHVRALLAVAMVGVVGLSVAVVMLATGDHDVAVSPVAGSTGSVAAIAPMGGIRYDGGPEEGKHAVAPALPPGVRYDGGPEEGTHAIVPAPPPGVRYDGGPEEGTHAIAPAPPPGVRYDGGPEEGSRGLGR